MTYFPVINSLSKQYTMGAVIINTMSTRRVVVVLKVRVQAACHSS